MAGDAALPFVYASSAHLLAEAAARDPRAEALVAGERRLDYAGYLACVAGFACELVESGLRGERIATVLGNSIDACIATFAVQAAGAQLVPLNPMYTARELAELLDDARPAMLLLDASLAPSITPVAQAAGVARIEVVGPGARALDAGWDPVGSLPEPRPRADGLALLQYTGGTTGRAKGVNLTHRAIMTNVAQREALLPVAVGERILCVMPLFHSYAMAMGLYLAAYSRGCLVVLPRYHPQEVLAAIERERITIFPGSPTLFVGLMSHPDFARADWTRVHTCYSGASALPEETLRRWREAVGAPVYEGYGQTEAGPVLSFNPVAGPVKVGSVGVAVPATQIQLVDCDTGAPLPGGRGVLGEIRARGPQVMSGYRNRPEETAEALRDGWLYTGDIGEFDEDGYLYIRDRKKDMLIVGGYNVYPREIEEVLMQHRDVAEAAVVGAPDPQRGESVHAFVVLRDGTHTSVDALTEHCRSALARYKIPARISVVAQLPRTGVAKTDKSALRALARSAAVEAASPGNAVGPGDR